MKRLSNVIDDIGLVIWCASEQNRESPVAFRGHTTHPPDKTRNGFSTMDSTPQNTPWPTSQPGRYQLTMPGQLSADGRALYDRIVGGPRASQRQHAPIVDAQGRLLGPFGLMTIAPAVGERVQSLGAALRFASSLQPRLREIAILTIAAHFQSEFEWFAHQPAASAAGITETQLNQLMEGLIPDGLTSDETAAATAIQTMLQNHTLTDDEYYSAIEALGEPLLAELVWLCGYYSMLALSLNVFAPANPLTNQAQF